MSTLKVDTYLTRGGASEIAIDKLKGVTAAGSMLVVGEGGTVTTNLQQGLAKQWIYFNGTSTIAIADSINTGSITDNATGDYTVTLSNNMANVNYSIQASSSDYTCVINRGGAGTPATVSAYELFVFYASATDGSRGAVDQAQICGTIHGDLA